MSRRGFGSHTQDAPPYIPRESIEFAVISHCKTATTAPLVISAKPSDGVTRLLERSRASLADANGKRKTNKWVVAIMDLTHRNRWDMLHFLVQLRNQIVIEWGETRGPEAVPDHFFRGFDFAATMYWIEHRRDDGDELIFRASPLRRLHNAGGGLFWKFISLNMVERGADFINIGAAIGETVLDAGMLGVEEWVKKSLRWLHRNAIDLGNGPADNLRSELNKGRKLGPDHIYDAALNEYLLAISMLNSVEQSNGNRLVTIVDALDMADDELDLLEPDIFLKQLFYFIRKLLSIPNVWVVGGGRQRKKSIDLLLSEQSWPDTMLPSLTVDDLRRKLSEPNLSLKEEEVEGLINVSLGAPGSEVVDLRLLSRAWTQSRR